MVSEIDICNMALYKVGSERITSFADDNKRAKICADIYEIQRDALLRAHPWNFCTKRVDLARTVNPGLFGLDFEFQLPSDCLRVISTEIDDYGDNRYYIEQRKLYCNYEAIKIEYISKVTDTAKYDATFVDTLAAKIALELSYALVQSNSLVEQLEGRYDRLLRDARLFDAQEGSGRRFKANAWTNSRY